MISEDAESLLVTAEDVIGSVEADRQGPPPWEPRFQPEAFASTAVNVAKRLAKTSLRQELGTGRTRPYPGIHPGRVDPDLRQRMRARGAGRAPGAARWPRSTWWADRHSCSLSRGSTVSSACSLRPRKHLDEPADGVDRQGDDARQRVPRVRPVHHRMPRSRLLDDVDAPVLAGLLSVFVHEHRSPEPPAPRGVPAPRRGSAGCASSPSARTCQPRSRRPAWEHGPPDPGFFAVAHGWTATVLSAVVGDEG